MLVLVAALALATAARAEGPWPMTVTDAVGREVTIPARPKAILLGSGFNLVALSLIHPDPVSLLAGWSGDMKGDNPEIYESFRRKFPAIADVPQIDDGTGPGLSFETLLTVKADLALLNNWQSDTESGKRAIEYLTGIGVPVIVVDFNNDALTGTPRMMRLLGQIFEREEQAEAFARFYEDKLALIRSRIAAKPEPRPLVLMDAFPQADRCCWAYGTGGLGEFLTMAGGRNIAEGVLPRPGGTVNAEAIMAANPDIYIATSSPGGKYGTLSIGPESAKTRRVRRSPAPSKRRRSRASAPCRKSAFTDFGTSSTPSRSTSSPPRPSPPGSGRTSSAISTRRRALTKSTNVSPRCHSRAATGWI